MQTGVIGQDPALPKKKGMAVARRRLCELPRPKCRTKKPPLPPRPPAWIGAAQTTARPGASLRAA